MDLLIFCDWKGADMLTVYRVIPKPVERVPCYRCKMVDEYGCEMVHLMSYDEEGGVYVCPNCGAKKTFEEAAYECAESEAACFCWPDYAELVEAYCVGDRERWNGNKYVSEPVCETLSFGPSTKIKLIAFSMLKLYNPKPVLAAESLPWGFNPPHFRLAFKVAAPKEVWEALKTLRKVEGKSLKAKDMEEILKRPTPEKVRSVLAIKALVS